MASSVSNELSDDLFERFRAGVKLKDRTYRLKTYKNCFLGSEAVKVLRSIGNLSTDEEAVELGNLILEAGEFHHVLREHPFENAPLFYTFSDGHGEQAIMPQMKVLSNAGPGVKMDILEALSPLDSYNLKLLDNVHPRGWQDPKREKRYHMVVIGAGSGGLVTAAGCAGLGARVALIEKNLMGGDCLNYGCVPSKALISSAKALHHVKNEAGLAKMGITVDGVQFDFAKTMERLRRLRADISEADSAERFSKKLGVDVYIGAGTFVDKNSVHVNGQTFQFVRCTIATGGAPRLPTIPGIQELFQEHQSKSADAATMLTNESIFNLVEMPPRLAVIGNGAIGLEMAQCFTRFGSRVTVFGRGGRIMGKEDVDMANILQEKMEMEGTQFILSVEIYVSVAKTGKRTGNFSEVRLDVKLKGQDATETMYFDALLVAAGRTPNVYNLNLEKAGVEYSDEGIKVNDRLQTTNASIYSVGDCCTAYKFTHIADFMARIVIRNSLFFGKDKFSSLLIPWSTYTEPEVAHVGLYESDVTKKYGGCVVIEKHFAENDRAILEDDTTGLVRIYVDKSSDKILGASVIGNHAGDLISEITVAMKAHMGLGGIASVIHPYPTRADAIRATGDIYNRRKLTPASRVALRQVLRLQKS